MISHFTALHSPSPQHLHNRFTTSHPQHQPTGHFISSTGAKVPVFQSSSSSSSSRNRNKNSSDNNSHQNQNTMSFSQQARQYASEIGKSAESAATEAESTKDIGHKMTSTGGGTTTVPVSIIRGETNQGKGAKKQQGQQQEEKHSTEQKQQQEQQQQRLPSVNQPEIKSKIAMTTEQAKQAVPESVKQGVCQAAQFAQQTYQGGKNFTDRHPYLVWIPVFLSVFLMGMILSFIPVTLMGFSQTSQPLISRMWHGPYDYYSYPKGSTEAHAHHLLDQAVHRYKEQQHQSRLNQWLQSLGLKGTEYISGVGGGRQESPSHLLPESLYQLMPGMKQPSEETHMSDFLSSMMKGGLMGKTATTGAEKKSSFLSSWFGRRQPELKHEEESSLAHLTSLLGGGGAVSREAHEQQPKQKEGGWFSGLAGKMSRKAKDVVSYTGLTAESEEQQLRRLIQEAAMKASRL